LRVENKPKPLVAPPKARGRKNAPQMKLLDGWYERYAEGMDEKMWKKVIDETGMSKKQVNKYLWDIKNRHYLKE